MRNNLNVDRMKRYVARTTPDYAEICIDTISPFSGDLYQKWLIAFRNRMAVKYPGGLISVIRDEKLANFPGEVVFKVHATPAVDHDSTY